MRRLAAAVGRVLWAFVLGVFVAGLVIADLFTGERR